MINNYLPEEWKDFNLNDCDPSLGAYKISNYGRVKRRTKTQTDFKLMSKFVKAGKFNMFFYKKKGNKSASYYLHRAVAQIFIDNKENKKFVIHLDYNYENNAILNLKWTTREELNKHRRLNPNNNLIKNAKLTEGKVKIIKRKLFNAKNKTRVKMIAKQFGITSMQVWRIKTGENWSHVTDW